MNTMPRKNRFLNSLLSIILILSITLTNVSIALADEGPTPEPTVAAEPTEEPIQPTVEPTEPPVLEPTEPPVVATEPPVVETPIPTEVASTEETPVIEEQAPIAELLTQAPENTDLVVLDENGEALSLTSQEALNTILETDPMWCPAGVLPGGVGCTTNFATIALLIADMTANTTTYDENGIIYFTTTPGASFSLTTTSLGTTDFNTLNDFNLTLQGGWNGLDGASATFTGQTNFGSNTLTIGSSGNPWVGNITLNNFSFSNVSSGAAVTVYTTSGNITLDNVDVLDQTSNTFTGLISSTSGNITVQNNSSFDGNSSNQSQGFSATTGSGSITISNTTFSESIRNGTGNTYDGATLSAPIVTLNSVTATGNDGDGITINSANIVTLNNVTATNNGTASGAAGLAGNDGSGVFINGTAGSRVIIIGGTYTGNQEYGVEVASPANTTIYIQTDPTCTGNASNSPLPPAGTGVGSCYNDTTVFDNTPPAITFVSRTPAANANGWNNGNVTVNWSCSDSGSGVVSATVSQTISTEGTNQSATGTCQDLAGNVASNTQSGINIDKTAPTAIATVVPSPNANGWNNTDVTVTFTGTDAGSGIASCSAAVAISTEGAGQASSAGTCTDFAGNSSAPVSATGINIDKTSPVIAFTSRTPANANGWNNTDVTVNWSCTDGLSGPASASVSQTVTTEGANQSATGTCQDLAGNTATDTQSGINIDKTAPTLNLPSNIIVEATSPLGAVVNYSASASDNLDAAPSFGCVPISGSTFVIGTTMVNCTASDHADNTSFGNFNVTVQDTTGPVIEFHSDVTAEATSASGENVTYTSPATTDDVDGPGVAICSPVSGSLFALGDSIVTCNATDSNNNAAIPTTFTVHVVDTTAPVIAAHADVTVEATSALGAIVTYTSPTTSDIVDGAGTASCSPSSGENFALGNTTVTCNAIDAHGNFAIPTTFVIHVVDTTAPVIATHADVTAEATSASGAAVSFSSPATSDIVDGSGTASCSPVSGSTFALGNTTVTCNATDSNNNPAVPTTFVVHVVDTTAPVIDPHADVFVAATSAAGAVVSYTSPATSDAVDGAGIASCAPVPGSLFPIGNTTVTCNAADSHNNVATSTTFVVHVVDTAAPVIDGHLDETVEATSAAGAIATYTSPATSDAVDGPGVATCSPASGTFFVFGSTTVTCNATDTHGNSAAPTTFVIHVVDTTAPVIAAHANVTAEATSASGAAVTYTSPATSDAVDGAGVASCSPASGSTFALGNTTVTCNATDSHSNASAPTAFVIHVVDTTAPVIAAHSNVSVITNNNLGTIVSYSSSATSDAVDGAGTATCLPASGSFFPVGDTLVTCNAIDTHGNAAQPVTFIVHVEYQLGAPTQTPTTKTDEGGLSIPITGSLLDLDCLTVIDVLGIKVTFHNLCDYQAAVSVPQTDTLPAHLPNGYSFVQGLNVLVLFEQQVVKALPAGTGVQLDFPIPANSQDQFSVLLWDDEDGDGNGEWLDVTQLVMDQNLSKVMSADPNDELYQITPTKTLEAFYRVITTEKTGTFVLVKK